MKKQKTIALDFEIDKLTNSIENSVTHEVFDTCIVPLLINDFLDTESEWQFDWAKEMNTKNKEVYKLTTVNNTKIIQGIISIEDKKDHIFMHLVESSDFNKGKNKIYLGVPGNLVAFACKVSLEKGYDGFVAFDAKSSLIKHYQETLLATHFKGLRMYIDPFAAKKLIEKYFKY